MNTSSSTSSSTSSFSSINLDQKFIIDSKITDTQSLRLFDKAENLDQISLKLQELPLLTSIKNKINSAFIIKIISNLRTYYEKQFVLIKENTKLLTIPPLAAILDNTKGSLYEIIATILQYSISRSISVEEIFNHKVSEVLPLLFKIDNVLKKTSWIPPTIYLHSSIPSDFLKIFQEVVLEHDATLTDDYKTATHVVIYHPEIDNFQDELKNFKRKIKNEKIQIKEEKKPLKFFIYDNNRTGVLMHYQYLPNSYNEWKLGLRHEENSCSVEPVDVSPESASSELTSSLKNFTPSSPTTPYLVSLKFLIDVEQWNEWGHSEDYELTLITSSSSPSSSLNSFDSFLENNLIHSNLLTKKFNLKFNYNLLQPQIEKVDVGKTGMWVTVEDTGSEKKENQDHAGPQDHLKGSKASSEKEIVLTPSIILSQLDEFFNYKNLNLFKSYNESIFNYMPKYFHFNYLSSSSSSITQTDLSLAELSSKLTFLEYKLFSSLFQFREDKESSEDKEKEKKRQSNLNQFLKLKKNIYDLFAINPNKILTFTECRNKISSYSVTQLYKVFQYMECIKLINNKDSLNFFTSTSPSSSISTSSLNDPINFFKNFIQYEGLAHDYSMAQLSNPPSPSPSYSSENFFLWEFNKKIIFLSIIKDCSLNFSKISILMNKNFYQNYSQYTCLRFFLESLLYIIIKKHENKLLDFATFLDLFNYLNNTSINQKEEKVSNIQQNKENKEESGEPLLKKAKVDHEAKVDEVKVEDELKMNVDDKKIDDKKEEPNRDDEKMKELMNRITITDIELKLIEVKLQKIFFSSSSNTSGLSFDFTSSTLLSNFLVTFSSRLLSLIKSLNSFEQLLEDVKHDNLLFSLLLRDAYKKTEEELKNSLSSLDFNHEIKETVNNYLDSISNTQQKIQLYNLLNDSFNTEKFQLEDERQYILFQKFSQALHPLIQINQTLFSSSSSNSSSF